MYKIYYENKDNNGIYTSKLSWKLSLAQRRRWEFKEKFIKTVFKSSASVKLLLYQKKLQLLPNSYPLVYVYTLHCS